MEKDKLIHQLFIGKVSELIGFDKTTELLKESIEAINEATEPSNETKSMKHWKEGRSECGHGENGITLKAEENIISVVKTDDGIQLMEECDGCFYHVYTKEETLELIDELKAWITEI